MSYYAIEWIKQQAVMNTTNYDALPSMCLDTMGNVYVAYYTTGTVSGGINSGSYDIVVFKMDNTGAVVWIQQQAVMNTNTTEFGPKICVDATGNVYVSYYTSGTVSGGTNSGGTDIVVFKLDTNGIFQWIKQQAAMNTTGSDSSPNICTDLVGNVYVTYTTYLRTVSGGTNSGADDIVVFKLNTNGTMQWIKQQPVMNTTGTDYNPRICVDSTGNVYVSYTSYGTVSGGTNSGSSDIVVLKIDTNGTVQWIQQQAVMNTSSDDSSPSICVDTIGDVYVSYNTTGTVSGGTNRGDSDIVVFKMNNLGAILWITQQPVMNTTGTDGLPNICTDAIGNVYVTHYTDGKVTDSTNSGGSDIVVFKLDTNGTFQWIQQHPLMNTTGDDYSLGICIDAIGNVYVSYYTYGTVSGGTNSGSSDIVVFKMSQQTPSAPSPSNPHSRAWVLKSAIMNTNDEDTTPSICVDAVGNSYITYRTDGTVSSGTKSGSHDIVVCKINRYGTVVWIKQQPNQNTTNSEYNPSITVDTLGNTYVAYQTLGTVSGGTFVGAQDIVVFKLDTNGTVVWIKQHAVVNTTETDQTPRICVDEFGNTYVAYQTITSSTGGNQDIVLFKLDTNGTVVWVNQMAATNTSSNDLIPNICIDAFGYIYVTYYTVGTISGGFRSGSFDIVIIKLDTNGNIIWTKQNGTPNSSGSESFPSISVDGSGNIYVAFHENGTISGGISSGGFDVVVAKLDTNGNVLWVKQDPVMNTPGSDYYISIATDNLGNVYVSYVTSGTVSGGVASGGFDVVVAKLDTNGNILWVTQDPVINTSSSDGTITIAVDSYGSIYICYNTGYSIRDVVIAKIEQPVLLSTLCTDGGIIVSWIDPVIITGHSLVAWNSASSTGTGLPTAIWKSIAGSTDGSILIACPQSNGTTPVSLYISTDYGITWSEIGGSSATWDSIDVSPNGLVIVGTTGTDQRMGRGEDTGLGLDYTGLGLDYTFFVTGVRPSLSVPAAVTGNGLVAATAVFGSTTSANVTKWNSGTSMFSPISNLVINDGAYAYFAGLPDTSSEVLFAAMTTGNIYYCTNYSSDGTNYRYASVLSITKAGVSISGTISSLSLSSGGSRMLVTTTTGNMYIGTLTGTLAPATRPTYTFIAAPAQVMGRTGGYKLGKLSANGTCIVAGNYDSAGIVYVGKYNGSTWAFAPIPYELTGRKWWGTAITSDGSHIWMGSDGGTIVNGYMPNVIVDAPSSPTTLTGLSNGILYNVGIYPYNASEYGDIVTSRDSPSTLPYPVTNVKAVAQDSKAIVTWTEPISDGGNPITSYTVTSNNAIRAVTYNETSAIVSGLAPGSSHVFSVYASNSSGNSIATATSFVVPTTPVVRYPVPFPDCTPWVWFDAADPTTIASNGALLTSWQSKGSAGPLLKNTNGRVMTGADTINNRNVITFTRGSKITVLGLTGGPSAAAGFFVMRPTTDICATGTTISLFTSALTTNRYISFNIEPAGNQYNVRSYVAIRSPENTISLATLPNQYYTAGLYSFVASGSTANTYTGYNGSSLTLNSVAVPSNISTGTGEYQINTIGTNTSMQYAEAVMFSGEITTTLRYQIEGYLAWKWGLQSQLPVTHPYSPANYIATMAAFRRPRSFVTTFAGSGTAGTANGTGTSAQFNNPVGIVQDSKGNLFVTEITSQVLRKITPEGVVSVFASISGFPLGITIDSEDNMYITRQGAIAKVTPSGTVTNYIGSGAPVDADGTFATARFDTPTGITFDLSGNLYVCSKYNIRKISISGNSVTTFVGPPAGTATIGDVEGTGNAARFHNLGGIACDSNGNLFVCDDLNNKIKKITPAGVVTIFAGPPAGMFMSGTEDGIGNDARFSAPSFCYIDKATNYIYVTENTNHRIRRISPSGIVTTIAGPGPTVPPSSGSNNGVDIVASFWKPSGILLAKDRSLYVTEQDGQRIRKLSPGLNNQVGTYDTGYGNAEGIAIDGNGTLYVSDNGNRVITKITQHGLKMLFAGTFEAGGYVDGVGSAALFGTPRDITFDAYDNLYVSDFTNHNIRKITKAGSVTTLAGIYAYNQPGGYNDAKGTNARFSGPNALTIDQYNNLYVIDENAFRIRKITPQGVVTTVAGSGITGTVDGIGTSASFNAAYGITPDNVGNMIVSNKDRLRKVNGNIVTTMTGAIFNDPNGLLMDKYGNIYVADTLNFTIKKISPNGTVSLIAGSSGNAGSSDGIGSAASFNDPLRFAYDSNSDCLLLTDRFFAAVRIIKLYPEDPVPYNNSNIGTIQTPGLTLGFQGQILFNPTYTGPTLPSSVTPSLWYDASDASTIVSNGTTLTGWKNKGSESDGQNGAVVGSVSTGVNKIGGKNVITFSANSEFQLSLPSLSAGEGGYRSYALFIVSKITNIAFDESTNQSTVFNVFFLTEIYGNGPMCYLDNINGIDPVLIAQGIGSAGDNGNISTTLSGTGYNQPTMYSIINSGITPNLNMISLNGSSQALDPNIAVTEDYYDYNLVINKSGTNGEQQVAEILKYKGDLTVKERQQIEAYLAYKWNLSANLSSSNPYSSNFVSTTPINNMFDMSGKTLVFCYKPLTATPWVRVFDFFDSTSTASSSTVVTITVIAYNASYLTRISLSTVGIGGPTTTTILTPQTPVLNAQYIVTLYYTPTSNTYTVSLYMYNGTSITTVASGISLSGPLAMQTRIDTLYLGRSIWSFDPYFNGSYQKVALYNGDLSKLPNNTIELQKLLLGSPANTYTSNTYTFNTTGQFLPVTVNTYNNPTVTGTEITLDGINQYLSMASYTQ